MSCTYADGELAIQCTEDAETGRKIPPSTLIACIREGKLAASGVVPYALTLPQKVQVALHPQMDKLRVLSEVITECGCVKLSAHATWGEKVPASLSGPQPPQAFEPSSDVLRRLLVACREMSQAGPAVLDDNSVTNSTVPRIWRLFGRCVGTKGLPKNAPTFWDNRGSEI